MKNWVPLRIVIYIVLILAVFYLVYFFPRCLEIELSRERLERSGKLLDRAGKHLDELLYGKPQHFEKEISGEPEEPLEIRINRPISENLTLFKNLNVGDSETAVQSKLRDDPQLSYSKFGETFDMQIGGWTFLIYPYYHNDQLYKIVLRSAYMNAEQRSKFRQSDYAFMKELWNNTKDMISEKYGEASLVFSFPSRYEIEEGYIRFTHVWNIGQERKIKLGISRPDPWKDVFFIQVHYLYRPIEELIEKEEKEKRQKTIEEDSKQF